MSKKFFGIDFGTTNSALSVNINGEVMMVNIDRFNIHSEILKSVIYFNPEEMKFYVGQQAVNHYIENSAHGRYIQSIKSFLADQSFEKTKIGREYYNIEQLIAIILRTIKNNGQKYISEEINQVVLGRPVIFSENIELEKLAVNRLLSAAKLAGFNEVHLQYEPIAAALAFESSLSQYEEKIIFVGDFGGGTSDFAIIKARGGKYNMSDRKKDILAVGGVYVGGDNFDSQLMWEKVAYYFGKNVKVKSVMSGLWFDMSPMIMSRLRKWHLIPFLRVPEMRQRIRKAKYGADNKYLIENLEVLVDDNYGYMLFQAIEKAKCELSSFFSSNICFEEFQIRENVTRSEFESFIFTDIQKIKLCVDNVIKQAGISQNDVDVVFLTGGSSYMPIIKKNFTCMFGAEKINQTNAFTSVAFGLGVSGNLFF